MIPVYLINGFLDSGKSEFIQYTISQPYFQSRGNTLLIACEEGEVEYDTELLKKTRTHLEFLEEEEEFNSKKLIELEKIYKPARIIIEYNGMWSAKSIKLPWHWKIEQQVTCVDGSTFNMYFTNMKSMLADMVRGSEMVIVNRCDGLEKQIAGMKRGLKAVNPQMEIIFEDKNGEMNVTLEEDLPFDLNADVITLDEEGYGIWYIDMMDNLERYVGKKVCFLAQVLHPPKFPKGYFVPGRMAMTCCEDDIAFLGYACRFNGETELEQRSFIQITVTVANEYFEDYGGMGPVLHAVSVEPAKKPKNEVISFM